MKVFSLKIDGALPVFTGILGSMFVCALIAVHGPGKLAGARSGQAESAETPDDSAEHPVRIAFLSPPEQPARDRILELYRDPASRDQVVDFFTSLCGSRQVASVILSNAATYNISPSLAFSLCWEESRYNPRAINRKNRDESVDRGLFQLNNRSFPNVAEYDFFEPHINAWYGMGHLRLCLDTGGTEIAALAMYNAGTGRVRGLGTPKTTLDYIHRVLEGRRKIERIFAAALLPPEEAVPAGKTGLTPAMAAAKPPRSWLVQLTPLSGNR